MDALTRVIHSIACAMVASCSIIGSACTATNPPDEPAHDAAIAGTVRSGLGAAMAGVSVVTVPRTRTVLTNGDGSFVIDGIDGGVYEVIATRDSAQARATTIATKDTGLVELRLASWSLAWSDEFDGSAIDDAQWHRPVGDAGNPKQPTRYRLHASTVDAGSLRITSTRDLDEPGAYSSGIVVTRRTFQYGRFEIRAKLPFGRGLWPAHWLWPLDKHSAPEIDIMEMLGHEPATTYMTYHYTDDSGARKKKSRAWRGFDRSASYHTYVLEWYPDQLRWLIDGVEYFRTAIVQTDEPMNVILNTNVGGDWPGSPDGSTAFPQHHDIDYVRVYRAVE